MDPYKLGRISREDYSGGTSGSESSWTRYIGSEGMQQTNNYAYAGHYSGKEDHMRRGSYNGVGDGCESDDSMASDASSGPSTHLELPSGSCNEGSLEVGSFSSSLKHATTKRLSKEKDLNQQVRQKEGAKAIRAETPELVLHQGKSSYSRNESSGQRGVKVRKNKWVGPEK